MVILVESLLVLLLLFQGRRPLFWRSFSFDHNVTKTIRRAQSRWDILEKGKATGEETRSSIKILN